MQEEHISLYYKDASSDNEYHVHLVQDAATNGWLVNFEYGKRGKALRPGSKTPSPLTYEAAKKLYDKVIKGQLKDGYTPDESGVPYQSFLDVTNAYAERQIGAVPQTLQKVSVETVMELLDDPRYIWQEKMDGERRPIVKNEAGVIGGNRDGLAVAIPVILAEAVANIPLPIFKIDGEDLREGRYAAFDLISCPEDPNGQRPYRERRLHLERLLRAAPSPCWVAIPTASTPEEAKRLLKEVADRNGEGLVGKLADAPYQPGESKNLAQVKFPFLDRVTCFVTAHTAGKRSVAVAVRDAGGNTVNLGNVTIPANYDVPAIGAIVDVQYLYAYRGGCLNQPVYKGVRGDRRLEHCIQGQLKFEQERNYQSLTDQENGFESSSFQPGV